MIDKNVDLQFAWGIYESDLYMNDNDFYWDFAREKYPDVSFDGIADLIARMTDEEIEECNDKKDNYYNSEIWYDCDEIRITEDWELATYDFIRVGKEIIMGHDESNDLIEKVLRHYFSADWDTWSITPEFDRWDWNAKLQNWDDADIRVKYRGGSWYCYAFCWYNSKQFI